MKITEIQTELTRIVGVQVTIGPCNVCGRQAEVRKVSDDGNGVATIQLHCHGEDSSKSVSAAMLKIVPFDEVVKKNPPDRLGGIMMGPFRGGVAR